MYKDTKKYIKHDFIYIKFKIGKRESIAWSDAYVGSQTVKKSKEICITNVKIVITSRRGGKGL